jgi:hypothetical protein
VHIPDHHKSLPLILLSDNIVVGACLFPRLAALDDQLIELEELANDRLSLQSHALASVPGLMFPPAGHATLNPVYSASSAQRQKPQTPLRKSRKPLPEHTFNICSSFKPD